MNVVKKMHYLSLLYTVIERRFWRKRRNVADMKDQDYHVFGQDDHEFGDGRPGDHHEILLKLWP